MAMPIHLKLGCASHCVPSNIPADILDRHSVVACLRLDYDCTWSVQVKVG